MSTPPVRHYCQNKGWIVSMIFTELILQALFTRSDQIFAVKWLYPQVLLILNNALSHSLPPDVTSLIQPMDQGVLENIKRKHYKYLLRELLLGSSDMIHL